jgi:hypothetical protein
MAARRYGGEDMNSDTIIAMSGLTGAVLTGALWDTPLAMTPLRWFVS